MKFSIITPTFRRHELLKRAVESLQAQTYKNWEMIIVNDSPSDQGYREFTSSLNDPRIYYHVNQSNKGVNYSRNFGLDKVSSDSTWIIFLDDDDFLSPDALNTFHQLIMLHQEKKWFVTNRAKKNGQPLTKFPYDDKSYSYALDYLILKRCKGDATHCIETKLITYNKAKFSQFVKQGEEWFFFYQIGQHSKLYYHDHNSTISDGYDASSGLNFRKRTFTERYESLAKLFYEGGQKKLLKYPSFLFYLFLRLIKLIVL